MTASTLDASMLPRRRSYSQQFGSESRFGSEPHRVAERRTIVAISSSTLIARGLESVLRASSNHFSVMQVESSTEALILSETGSAEIVLIDAQSFASAHVPDLCAQMKSAHPHAAIILMAPHTDKALIRECFSAGALCCICPDSDEFSILVAFSSAENGTRYLDPRIAFGDANDDAENPLFKLSAREREVHRLLTEGHSNRSISKILVISEATVKGHVSSILSKLGVTSRLAAALTPLAGAA